MAEEVNWLLTDEFVAFAAKIKDIHEKKKAKRAELKVFYDKIQAEYKVLDNQAKDLEDKFQAWKKSQESSGFDGRAEDPSEAKTNV
jgi:vacuolar-type H+-ATPase subunit I/STV1